MVDEIENSATMWKGISQKVHGYDAIDTDDAVTVRSEVARLTRLFDRAVKTNSMNDPDHYGSGISMDDAQRGLRSRPNAPFQTEQPQPQTQIPGISAAEPAPVVVAGPSADPDASPATQPPVRSATDPTSIAAPGPSADPDASPATQIPTPPASNAAPVKDTTPATAEPSNGSLIAGGSTSTKPDDPSFGPNDSTALSTASPLANVSVGQSSESQGSCGGTKRSG